MKVKVSDVIADFFAAHDIRHAFGIVGAANAHIFDSVARRGFTEIISVHHEQAACMAMQTYYRTCGTMAACIVTAGAGSSNAITGVVSAWMDSIPGIVLSGNENSKFTVDENPLRIWGVQGFDSVGMVKSVTKYAKRVNDPTEALFELEKAHHIALSGRPGPCWLDVPMNVQSSLVEAETLPTFEAIRPESGAPDAALEKDIDQVLAMLSEFAAALAVAGAWNPTGGCSRVD